MDTEELNEMALYADKRGCMNCDKTLTFNGFDDKTSKWHFKCDGCGKIMKIYREDKTEQIVMSMATAFKIATPESDAADRKIAELETQLALLLERDKKTYWTKRGHLLSYWGQPPPRPVVCCELYLKWYTLYVIYPSGLISFLEYTELPEGPPYEEGEPRPTYMQVGAPKYPAFSDHVPHPLAVLAYVDKQAWDLCDRAEELIVERWFRHASDLDTREIFERVYAG